MSQSAVEIEPDVEIRHLLCQGATEGHLAQAVSRSLAGVDELLVLRPLLVRGQDGLAEERGRRLPQLEGDGDNLQRRVAFALRRRCVLVEDDVAALVVVHAREALHEVAYLLPFVVVALEEVDSVLEGYDAGAAFAELGLCGQGKVGACAEGDDGCEGRFVGVFVVAQGTCVEDAVHLLEVRDSHVAEIQLGSGDAFGELGRIFVHVVQVVLLMLERGTVVSR